MSGSNAASSVFSSQEYAKNTAGTLGQKYDDMNSAYQDALTSGTSADIGKAKIARDKAEENYMSFLTTLNKDHDLKMQIIAMIGH